MARLLDRLQGSDAAHPSKVNRWSQRVCDQIEAALTDIIANQTDIFAALSTMPDIPDVHIAADYTGVANPDQFPVIVQARRLTNETDNTDDATWDFTLSADGITASIDGGTFSITDAVATCDVTISSEYNGVTKSRTFMAYFDVAPPPDTGTDSGGGAVAGTTAKDTLIDSIASASYAAVTRVLNVTIGSSGEVALSAPLTVSTAAAGLAGTYKIWGKWQWFDGGSSTWTDVGSEVASSPSAKVTSHVHFGSPTTFTETDGTLSVSTTKTGLTTSGTEKFRLMARNDSGTRTMTLSGTASAVA